MFGSWNWMNGILLLCLYLVLLIMYFILVNEVRSGKNLIMHVTFPYMDLTDPEIRRICETFKKKLKRVLWALAVLPFSSIFLPMCHWRRPFC